MSTRSKLQIVVILTAGLCSCQHPQTGKQLDSIDQRLAVLEAAFTPPPTSARHKGTTPSYRERHLFAPNTLGWYVTAAQLRGVHKLQLTLEKARDVFRDVSLSERDKLLRVEKMLSSWKQKGRRPGVLGEMDALRAKRADLVNQGYLPTHPKVVDISTQADALLGPSLKAIAEQVEAAYVTLEFEKHHFERRLPLGWQ
ncbi:MAG: hypothetical protein ACI8W8_003757 [Rhodothermales bacterium]|jgi:hypothetical protein